MSAEHISVLREFLSLLGIPATIEPTKDDHFRITISATAFERQRALIQAWFTPVWEDSDFVILQERLRGTGDTGF